MSILGRFQHQDISIDLEDIPIKLMIGFSKKSILITSNTVEVKIWYPFIKPLLSDSGPLRKLNNYILEISQVEVPEHIDSRTETTCNIELKHMELIREFITSDSEINYLSIFTKLGLKKTINTLLRTVFVSFTSFDNAKDVTNLTSNIDIF